MEAFLQGSIVGDIGQPKYFLKSIELIEKISAVSVALLLDFFDAKTEEMLMNRICFLGELTAI